MKNTARLFLLTSMLIVSHVIYAEISPSDLVRVNGKSSQKCVEYFTYKGEEYCSTKALSEQPVDPKIKDHETQDIVFDHRPWRAAWGKKTPKGVMIEYIAMGDDINNWHELVTSQFFAGLQENATPKEFADTIISGIKKLGYSPSVTFYRIKSDEVIFEFKIDHPEAQVQDEIQLIKKGKDGFYVLHYVIKMSDMGTINRELWIDNLLNSTIKSR